MESSGTGRPPLVPAPASPRGAAGLAPPPGAAPVDPRLAASAAALLSALVREEPRSARGPLPALDDASAQPAAPAPPAATRSPASPSRSEPPRRRGLFGRR